MENNENKDKPIYEFPKINKCNECGLHHIEKNGKKRYVRYPIRNPDGTWNYFNMLKTEPLNFFIIAMLILCIWQMAEYIKPCMACAQQPCEYAENVGCYKNYISINGKPIKIINDNGTVENYFKQSGMNGKYNLNNLTKC
jgi:hypothetical protein